MLRRTVAAPGSRYPLQKLLVNYGFARADFVGSQKGWLRLIGCNCDGDALLPVSNDGGQTRSKLQLKSKRGVRNF